MYKILCIFFLFSLYQMGYSFKVRLRPPQNVGVQGTLMCNDKPIDGVIVKLYDNDTLIFEDLLASSKSDSRGKFKLLGKSYEITRIVPKLYVIHNCNNFSDCQRKIAIKIPKRAISLDITPTPYFDVGEIELAPEIEGETRDCTNLKNRIV